MTVTLTGTFEDSAGTPESGRVIFALATTDSNGVVIVTDNPVGVILDANGAFSLDLQATDELVTSGNLYHVTERLNGRRPRSYYIELPADTDPANLADLATYDEPPFVVYTGTLAASNAGLNAHIAATDVHGKRWFDVKDYGARGDGTGDDSDNIQAALNAAAAAGGGCVYIPAGTYAMYSAATIPSNCVVRGDGIGATILLRKSTNALLQNADASGGNTRITIQDLTLDGNLSNTTNTPSTHLLELTRVGKLTVRDVEIRDNNGPGALITGNGTVTRDCHLTNILVTGCDDYGLWVGYSMRNVIYTGITARQNGQTGVVVDHSEALVNGIYAHDNGVYGVWLRNFIGASLNGLVATKNGQHGIFVDGVLSSVGTNWRAQNNGQSGAGYSDVYFSPTNSASGGGYGVTQNLVVSGIQAGHDLAGLYGSKTEDYGIYVGDGISELKLFAVNYSGAGNTDNIRVPSSPGNLVVLDTTNSTTFARLRSGNFYNYAGYFRGIEIADPAAPATNVGIAYFRDNGAGKTQLVVRFPTGAVQVVATEP